MENSSYLLAAFAVVWAGVFGLVFSLVVRQRRLRREIDALRQEVEKQSR